MTYSRWQRLTEWPLAAAAAGFLVLYAWTVLAQPGGDASATAEDIIRGIWVLFVVDYGVRLLLAENNCGGSYSIYTNSRLWCCRCCAH